MRVIRSAQPEDHAAMAKVFYLAVNQTARAEYSEAQCTAWCPAPPALDVWRKRLAGLDIAVSEVDGVLVEFIGLNVEKALVDFAFVHPDDSRAGHASALYAVIEGRARQAGLTHLTTEASRLAEPFFKSQGWHVVAHQEVERNGVTLPNARMAKDLTAVVSDDDGVAYLDRSA